MNINSFKIYFISSLLLGNLFCISPAHAGLFNFNQKCETLFTVDKNSEKIAENKFDLFTGKKLNKDKAIALFQNLPPKLRVTIAHDLAVYLAKNSPDANATERAAALFSTEKSVAPKTLNLAIEYIKKGAYLSSLKTDYLEFVLRMHPDLNEIMLLFNIPGFVAGKEAFEQDLNTVQMQLANLDPTQAQIAIRSTIDVIIEKTNKNINPYAFAILMKAAENLAVDKPSKYLANGLKQVFTNKSLVPNIRAAENQIRLVIRKTIAGGSRVVLSRIKSALYQSIPLDPNNAWGVVNIFGGVIAVVINSVQMMVRDDFEKAKHHAWYDVRWEDRYLSQDDFTGYTYFDHYNWQINTLGIFVASYGIKALYHFIYDWNDPHPGNYLREETDLELKNLNAQFTQLTASLYGILTRPQYNTRVISNPVSNKPSEVPQVKPEPIQIPGEFEKVAEVLEQKPAIKNNIKPVTKKEVLESYKGKIKSRWVPLTTEQTAANLAFFKYFDEVRLQLLERDTLLDHIQLSLLLNEPVNIQILGEPGVAKTLIAVKVLGQITDENGNPSLYRVQLGKNTTIGELIGIVKQSELKNDRLVRAAERALPGYKFAFLDEYYDATVDTRRDLLTLQVEGVMTTGGETYTSKGILTLYASNKYPNQVFFEAGSDAPRAEMDRMFATHIMSPTFEHDENMIDLETTSRLPMQSKFTFEQIDQLKSLIRKVEVPRYYLAKTKLIVNHLRRVEIKREHESKIAWHKSERNGDINLTPPEYMTRVLSPRSERIAYQLLKAFALMDWLEAKAKGIPVGSEPKVNESHFLKLVEFFNFNGPSDDHIDRILREYPEGSVPFQQFTQLRKGRNEFFELVGITDKNVDHQAPMQELHKFLSELNIQQSAIEKLNIVPLNETQKFSEANSPVVMELVEWHKQLGQKITDKPKIVEMSNLDVADFKAYNLGTLLIEALLGIK